MNKIYHCLFLLDNNFLLDILNLLDTYFRSAMKFISLFSVRSSSRHKNVNLKFLCYGFLWINVVAVMYVWETHHSSLLSDNIYLWVVSFPSYKMIECSQPCSLWTWEGENVRFLSSSRIRLPQSIVLQCCLKMNLFLNLSDLPAECLIRS